MRTSTLSPHFNIISYNILLWSLVVFVKLFILVSWDAAIGLLSISGELDKSIGSGSDTNFFSTDLGITPSTFGITCEARGKLLEATDSSGTTTTVLDNGALTLAWCFSWLSERWISLKTKNHDSVHTVESQAVIYLTHILSYLIIALPWVNPRALRVLLFNCSSPTTSCLI